jgi:choline dehydrogenase-like flavoprotein
MQWLIANAMKPNDLVGIANSRPDIYGAALQPFMQRAAKHFGTMVGVGEDLPRFENRVQLSAARDQFGVPLARTLHNLAPETIAMSEASTAEGIRVFEAAGAVEVWSGQRFGMHILGGTVMGRDAATSVTDSYGRVHGLDNLFIAGPGLFPTSGAVNPTFTIHALTLRTAEHLIYNA